jgi:type I restriction enzyme S subunit
VNEWHTEPLGQLVDAAGGVIRTGPFGSQLHRREYVDDGEVAVVMPKDMFEGRIDAKSVARISHDTAARLAEHRLQPCDIVLARRGDIGRAAWVHRHDGEAICGTGSMRIHLPGGELAPRYLHYFLQTDAATEWLQGQAVGATMPNLNAEIVRGLPVRYPNAQMQRHIVRILDLIDDVIENNRRRIALLDQMARAIYREWFVHFRYPGGEGDGLVNSPLGLIPAGWETARLGDVVELWYGKALKASARNGGPVAVVGSSGIVGWHDEPLVEGPTVVVGRKGNVGNVIWVQGDSWPIDTTYYVTTDLPLQFAYRLLGELEFINSHAAVPGLSREHAYSAEVLRPDLQVTERFDALASNLSAMTAVLEGQATVTTRIRDALLPKLITGAIDASRLDLDALIEESAE